MDELEPYTSEYLEIYISDGVMDVKVNAPLNSAFSGYLEDEIIIPDRVTTTILKKEILPKVKRLSEVAEKGRSNTVRKIKRKERGEGNFAQIQENDDTKQN